MLGDLTDNRNMNRWMNQRKGGIYYKALQLRVQSQCFEMSFVTGGGDDNQAHFNQYRKCARPHCGFTPPLRHYCNDCLLHSPRHFDTALVYGAFFIQFVWTSLSERFYSIFMHRLERSVRLANSEAINFNPKNGIDGFWGELKMNWIWQQRNFNTFHVRYHLWVFHRLISQENV